MKLVTYYKFGKKWYLDDPDYIAAGGDGEDLRRDGAFSAWLEATAREETTVRFVFRTQPLPGADMARLLYVQADGSGAYYCIQNPETGATEFELWLRKPEMPDLFWPEVLYLQQQDLN